MKTDLTKHIESLLLLYSPTHIARQKLNHMRNTRTVLECVADCGNVAGGIIDCVRIDETIINERRPRICYPGYYKPERYSNRITFPCGKTFDDLPQFCEKTDCRSNSYVINCENSILVTCFEIKVTKADFHSKHGHNFVGDANFYVMPKKLYSEVKDEIPENVGVIAYISTDKFDGLRCIKQSAYTPISFEERMWLILSVLKKTENNFEKHLLEEKRSCRLRI